MSPPSTPPRARDSVEQVEKLLVVARDAERFAAGPQKLQHLTFAAKSLAEACDVIGSQGCTLALVEWAGCVPEGVSFCGELRERFPSLPVLLVVPSGHQELRRAALLVGVDAVLAEPVDELELAETVRSLLLLKNLRESRHRFRARAEADAWIRRVYGALGCGVLVLDAQGIVLECNEVAAGIYGAAAASMVGRRIRDFIKPLRADGSPLPEAERTLRRVLSTKEPERRIESHFERTDGERRWTLLDAIPLDDADGQVELIVCSLVDVTDAHRAQEAIQRSEGILQRAQHLARVGSFELDLTTKVSWWSDELYRIYGLTKDDLKPTEHTAAFDRLVHPEDRWALERREKALKEGATTNGEFRIIRPSGEVVFVSISAEVVRDEDGKPLLFTGALQDISDRKRSELELTRLRDHFERVVSHIRDALVVFDAVGTIVYANKQFFALFGLPFGRPDQQVLGPLMPSGFFEQAALKEGELDLAQQLTYELLRADGSKLALEATITTAVHGREPIGKQVLFRDITERRLNERALAGKGTGLGLAMVHGIMRDHDGNVTVESLPGEGATFTLLLPTVEGLTDSENPSAPLVVPDPGQRILVVDGEPGLVRAASRFLGKLGYSVSGHHDAKEALVAFCSDPFDFDVLVADTALQGTNGLELARSMLELRPELPILLVTTQLDEGLRQAARALGIREIMQKPYGLAELSDAILRTAARGAAR